MEDHTLQIIPTGRYQNKVFTATNILKTTVKYSSPIGFTGQPMDQYIDIYQPKQDVDTTEPHRPCVILIHGGGFRNGSKNELQTKAKEWFARRGFVAVSMDYRLTTAVRDITAEENQAKVAVTDCQSVIRFMRNHALDYKIDPNRIALYGISAGGITAQMAGISSQTDWSTQSLVMPANTENSNQPNWVMAVITEAGAIYDDYRLTELDVNDCPSFYDFHGTNDTIVPYITAQSTQIDIQNKGLEFEMHSYQGYGHLGFPVTDLENESITNLYNNLILGDTPRLSMAVDQIPWNI